MPEALTSIALDRGGTRRRVIDRALAALGTGMRRHRAAIIAIQWTIVLCYFTLLAVPAVIPLPPEQAGILDHVTRFAQFAFWGVWWPFVMVSVVTMGRIWCGVFCPEGALTEWISHRGLGRGIPRWMRWGGWPFVAFLGTTVYGQLVSVYEYPKAAALVLGGSTLAALAVGFVYGRGKRVWCRHLCPANGVFALLARIAPVHYRVDRQAWESAPPGARTSRGHAVNCAPLIDIRRMQSAAACHMCGRCAGERGAVTLASRPTSAEVVALDDARVSRWEATLLVFGVLGVALGAFQWSASPWFVAAKQSVATWLIDRGWTWAVGSDAPWWLLTHYPEKNDVFTWLDGALIVGYIGATAVVTSVWIAACLAATAAFARVSAWRLAYALIPLAGVSVFLGLSALTVTLLKAEGLPMGWVGAARALLLALALAWSARLAWGMARSRGALAGLVAAGGIIAAASAVVWLWIEMFYVW
ncbi:MAG: 4Fe-4S binding protein [Burkholderiales bacterium]|nr:4Fe-4S binding protein [Burkholderiales bacterium]